MQPADDLRAGLGRVLGGPGGPIGSADRLCRACVELLEVDGAAISIVFGGVSRGTFGSSGDLSRRVDEMQYTLGEGPCLDAVQVGRPVFIPDLLEREEQRWPAFASAAVSSGVRSIVALPVTVAAEHIGALDLFRHAPGAFSDQTLDGALWAADLAALPLLDLMRDDVDWDALGEASPADDGWAQLASLDRLEIHQATGMIMRQLGVTAPEALVRLRAYAFANDLTTSEVAWSVVERRLSFKDVSEAGDVEEGGRA